METLVAIFVMAIGLLALLTLFPLGALNMAQAIKDDRCAQVAEDADAISRAWNIRKDADVVGDKAAGTPGALFDPDPLPAALAASKLVPAINPQQWDGASYPVYIDPVGWLQSGGTSPLNRAVNSLDVHVPPGPPSPAAWLGGNLTLTDHRGMTYSGVPRRSLRFLNNDVATQGGDPSLDPLTNPFAARYRAGQLQKWCTLLDDMTFKPVAPTPGLPPDPDYGVPIATLGREGRYSWAYLVRLTAANQTSLVDLSVVVYSGRPMALSPTGQPAGEHGYAATFTQGSKVATLRWNPLVEEQPPIRKGVWIMDGTLVSPQLLPAPATMVPDPHGFLYRVVNYTDVGLQNGFHFMDLELQQYARYSTSTVPDLQGFSPGYWGRLVILENVAEVFERGS